MSSKQRQFTPRYWTGWQQLHEHLVKQTEVSLTVLPAGGSRVTYRRRPVNFRCGRDLVDARSGFRPDCGQHLSACRERKRPARVGHHHGGPTRMCYRGHRCCCLPALGPGGTLACEHTCLPPPVSVIIVKLSEFRVQTATRVDKGVSAVSERMRVLGAAC